MKDFYKNTNLYFIIVPLIAALWVLLLYFYSVPTAEKTWTQYEEDYKNSIKVIANIIQLDPERLNFETEKKDTDEFDYAAVIDFFAEKNNIPSSAYKVGSSKPTTRGKVTVQTADVSLDAVNVDTMANFLSSILAKWPDLKCNLLTLKKHKNEKDLWTVSMKLSYTY